MKEDQTSFAETTMRLGGKSEEEARRTGAVDRADDQVEALFAPQYKTSNSPVHRAVWDQRLPIDLFMTPRFDAASIDLPQVKDPVEIVRDRKRSGTLCDEKGKITEASIAALASAGYWGLFIPKEYGGSGLSNRQFMNALSKIAMVHPIVAGLGSVHSCIGAVDPVLNFGNHAQKQHFLPKLATGEMVSAFGLTEPNAGSDLTALRTSAELRDGKYYLNGEKLFITNATYGRTVCIVALVKGKPAVLVVDFPKQETEGLKFVDYGIYAIKNAYNRGLKFKDFPVPEENLLKPSTGDGLTIAYHGLNRGRLALCASASSAMKIMLSNMLPWAKFRHTYGMAIIQRELVKRRIAKTASLICGAEALYNWGSWLLDLGYRGELECILAKIFGSEAQKEVAIEYFMKTHGGRSFLHGHLFGDMVHEFLAPCIYEGEGEMLGMAFFKSLAKEHGVKYFEPVGHALAKQGNAAGKGLNPFNPLQAFALRNELFPYAAWYIGKFLEKAPTPALSNGGNMNPQLKEHIEFAVQALHKSPFELTHAMIKHQLKLADRQCCIADMSARIQNLITIVVAASWAHNEGNPTYIAAADVLCHDLRYKLSGERIPDTHYRRMMKVADMIIETGYPGLEDIEPDPILFPYN
jgi:alkylation response protein AidB-like acyl-CoA dehydrogenase